MVSVVIPTYNEAQNIAPLIEDIASQLAQREHEIIVVDDNSEDSTREKVRGMMEEHSSLELIAREGKKGIGSAYKHGFSRASKDILVQMDADFSHPPEKITHLVKEVEEGAKVAVGSRYVEGGTRNDPLHRRINPIIGSYLYRYLIGSPVKDVTSGFKAYRRETVEDILEAEHRLPDGFHFQAASLMHLVERGHEVREVPIDFMPRRAGDPKYDIGDLIDNVKLLLQLGARKHLNRR